MNRFALAVLVPLVACAADPQPTGQKTVFTAEQVHELAVTYAKENALWDDKLTVGKPVYVQEADSWIVSFKRDTLKLGEGGFFLVVTDETSHRISLQKGL